VRRISRLIRRVAEELPCLRHVVEFGG
jgi:hypothetical protein